MRQRVTWIGHTFNGHDGYASFNVNHIRELTRRYYPVSPVLNTVMGRAHDIEPDVLRLMGVTPDAITIQCLPADMMPLTGRVWGYTMFEDTALPSAWVKRLNRLERVLVPSEWQRGVLQEYGVTVPVHVVHGGVDPERFAIRRRWPERRTYTFLALSAWGNRKGTEQAVNAFRRAFPRPQYPDVRLVIKAKADPGQMFNALLYSDPRIVVHYGALPRWESALAGVDCYVYPSLGDGWGLTPREVACMGIPVIAPRHTALTVGIDDWATYTLETFHRKRSNYLESPGYWQVCDVDEIAHAMQWAYACRETARAKSFISAHWLRANQTWKQASDQLTSLLEDYR